MVRVLRFSAIATAAMLSAAGCGSICTPGIEFRVFKPASVSTNAVVNQMTGAVGVAPLAAYPALPAGRTAFAQELTTQTDSLEALPMPSASVRTQGTRFAATGGPCSMDEICKALIRIEAALSKQAQRMPGGE